MDTPLGSPLRRKEDQRFITGRGRYVEDLRFPGMLHAAFVRSPHAHARVKRVDLGPARALPGVVAAYAASDLPECGKPIPPSIAAPGGFRPTAQPVFADRVARYVGEVVAAVVAADSYAAADAAAAVLVDYEPLPAAGTMERALESGAPKVFDSWPDNVAGLSTARVGDPATGFAEAQVIVEARLGMARVAGVPIETRGIVVEPEGPDGRLTLWTSSQSPYGLRAVIAGACGLLEEQVRVVVVDTGGGFGIKGHAYPEDLILAAVARRLRRPVKWIESRREHFLTASPDRGQQHTARLGLTREGRITAVETRFARDHGAYLASGEVVTRNTINHLPGPYRIPHLEATASNVVTHGVFGGAYRGSGRPEASFVLERLLDRGARALGLDPAELRRRNMIRADEMPYRTGLVYRDGTPIGYDPADYVGSFDRLLADFDYAGWRRRQAETRSTARPLGVGLAAYVQGTGVGPFESADVRIDSTGAVHVRIGVSSQGQSHETTMAQIAAAELGVDPARVSVVAADTTLLPYGNGTGGSRVAANAGPAVARTAREVAGKARVVAAEMLECAAADVVLAGGRAHVAGVPQRAVPLGDLARAAVRSKTLLREARPGLQFCGYFAPETVTFAFGAQACAVEVDVDTGQVRILRYLAVHDAGRAINPLVVDGQLHGGLAGGIGTALTEALLYGDDGQLLTGSLMDYAIPLAADLPTFETRTLAFPSPRKELGIKGVGESAIIAPPAAIANAVEDALASRGADVLQVPITPSRVWTALRGAAAGEPPAGRGAAEGEPSESMKKSR
ncbi:MAG TPA: xanthine dehydrogenase family protein molybdopterin-binding subunit [Candidatus Deferrimicrobiaceae bacterium]|nr:xanthine dehydrogenase family protein molybdopterin-binding subunit [Candidatus Deferrimicrobiaceae bacterium]